MEIDLTQACVGELNTILRGETNWPIIYGVGVNIKTGEIFPASFPDKGPDLQLRQARNFTGGQTVSEEMAIKLHWRISAKSLHVINTVFVCVYIYKLTTHMPNS